MITAPDEIENLKRTNSELSEEIESLRLLFQQAPLAYQSIDKDGTIIDVNDTWLRMLGYNREEVIGKFFVDFLAGTNTERFKTNFTKNLAKGELLGEETEILCRDGRIITVKFNGKTVKDKDGHFRQTHFFLADETEKRRLEKQKQLQFETMHIVFDAIPYGLMIVGPDEKILMINQAGASLMGFSHPRELVGTSHLERIHSYATEIQHDSVSHGFSNHFEYLLSDKSGLEIPILKTAIPVMFGEMPVVLEAFVSFSDQRARMEELSESKRKFTTLLDNLPGMVYRCRNDHDWTMEFISDGCIELTGYMPEELVLNKLVAYNDLIVPEDQERIWNEVQQALQANKPFTFEYRVRCADGRIKWVWEKGRGLCTEEGDVLFIEGFMSDISEYKYAEQIQRVLFEISKTSYTSLTIDEVFKSIHKNLGLIIDVENFYLAMYDETRDMITLPYQIDSNDSFASFPVGKSLTSFVIRSRKPLLANQKIIEDLSRTGNIDIIGTPAKVWLGVPLLVSDKVIGVIAVQSYTNPDQYTSRDLELLKFVADHIATTISKKRAEELFQKEKAYLDQLFEGSPEAIVMTDNLGNVLKANSAFTKLFGYTQQEVFQRNIDDLISEPEYREESVRITSDIRRGITTETETRRNHKEGHLIDVSILVTPITIDDHIVGGYGIYRDITDHKRIEKSLIAAKDKAEGADRLKSAFLANMSHEIRTPMNAILGFSSLLSEPDLSDEEQLEFIQIIKERGNDLMRIIDDIIDVAKIESGQIKIEIRDCKLNVLMSDLIVTLNEVKRKTSKTKIALVCKTANNDPDFTIPTDGNRLRQILTNLIENGLKFTDEGSVEFGYTVNDTGSSRNIEFYVRDTGIGIPPEMHDIIFERFRQVDDTATRKYGGAGLGLTISRNLTHLLGGHISLESERGKGTTFSVRLPMHYNTTKLPDPVQLKRITLPLNKWSERVILVVEDEDSNFLLIDRMLKSTGVKLVWAKNGMEAIDLCRIQQFDLVLMDIRMPVMDGYETTLVLKTEHKDLPVIAQTAYALKGEREKSIAAGCDNYISKPISSHELLAVLEKYLNKQ